MRKPMEQMPSIKLMMSPFPYQIGAAATLAEADAMMRQHDIRHLPVTETGTLVGVLSWNGLQRALREGTTDATAVRDIDVAQATCFELTEPLDRVLSHMAETHVECVMIIKNEKLAGIFTLSDACRCFAEFLHTIFPPKDGNDAA